MKWKWDRVFSFREIEDEPKPFLTHVEELRFMMMKMVIALLAMMVIAFCFQKQIMLIIEKPMLDIDPERKMLVNLGVAEPFTIAIELSFYAGIVAAFPFLVFFLAQFVLPALTPVERRLLYPAAAVSLGLFLVGVVFAYFFVLPPTLDYFFTYSRNLGWTPQWTVREYFSFTTQFIISFGLAFELPLGVLLLLKLGLVDLALLQRTRAFAVIVIFLLAAIITPTSDILTLVLMGGPMYLLYEACIFIAWVVERRQRRRYELEKATRG